VQEGFEDGSFAPVGNLEPDVTERAKAGLVIMTGFFDRSTKTVRRLE